MQEVEEICDRVAILCRGRLVALDTPLALRQEHSERKVDAILTDGSRWTVDLDQESERTELARQVDAGTVASLKTREFNFHEAFLKLTGTEFT
jgi:ABC-2 type transport system ATP-binding protein